MGIVNALMNRYVDTRYKTLKDLPVNAIMKLDDKYKIDNTKILIIDDDKLDVENTLRRIGYRVSWKTDIDELMDVESYSVIVCDYKGVGLNFNSDHEGLNLIKLIKEKYPNKIVYLLSAASFSSQVNDYLKYADELILKGEEEKLIEYIKQDIEKFFNPVESWKMYKMMLLNKGITEKEIMKLEDLYVRSFIEKKDILSKDKLFLEVNNNLNVKFDIKVGIINI